MRLRFYFTPCIFCIFPVFLSIAVPLTKENRQLLVQFAITGPSESQVCPPLTATRFGGATTGHGEAPHISASSWEAVDKQKRFTQGPRAARLPCSLDNQKQLLQRRLFHPISRSPSFHFPNSFLAAKSARTDITLR